MTKAFGTGEKVQWNWGNGTGEAEVKEVHTERVEREIAGTNQVRNGTDDNPAYVLEQSDGRQVLKLHSELGKA
jgi:hypothetical protein